MAVRKEKEYIFSYQDKNGNELQRKTYEFYNLSEARKFANLILANDNANTSKIKIFQL
jgi:hypothetical protein